ncbi:ABC transporter ATP-binding protein [uncultured Pseudokineococcus sp.]|uniref:ABC transporter ATP-binding protein n=1 Tax=uncultured Pseudokineococcus sp. TaxID=1642928 RepID=UPI002639AE4E|nr:ABC transporter ATP-binding protein [uncultured Pseudokineococcus sp.]
MHRRSTPTRPTPPRTARSRTDAPPDALADDRTPRAAETAPRPRSEAVVVAPPHDAAGARARPGEGGERHDGEHEGGARRAPGAGRGRRRGESATRRGLRVVVRGARDEPLVLGLAVLVSAVYGAGTAAAGWLLGRTTDGVLVPLFAGDPGVGGADIAGAGLALAGVAVVTAVAVALRRMIAGRVFANLQARYRRRLAHQYLRLPIAWHHRHPAGQLLSNASSDVEASFQIFQPLPMALGVVVMALVASVAMVAADPVLAAVGLLTIPAMAAANIAYQKAMSPRVVRAQALRGEVAAMAHESFDGAVVVKTLGREGAETERFGGAADRLREANVDVGRTRGAFDPVVEALPSLASLAVLAVGAARAASGDVQVGDIVQVVYLLTILAAPVRAFGWVLAELPRSAVGFGRVRSVLEATGRTRWGSQPLPEGGLSLSMRGVRLAHVRSVDEDLDETTDPDAPTVEEVRVPALVDVDLDVPAGSTTALVGPTGSGKSTLAALAVRLVDPDAGVVRLGGVDVRELAEGSLPAEVSLVPQGTFIFDDTVRGNITLGADVDEARLRAALETSHAAEFVDVLPDGLDTRVGERGASLSGGQRQRIALARALLRSPRLLVLDDATSAVDPAVEAQILSALRRPPAPGAPKPTVLLVAYRRATIALADRVAWMDGGRVVDEGTHAELLERQPGYRHLVTAYEEAALASARPPGGGEGDGGAPAADQRPAASGSAR